ncbi:MAG: HK97 family phage prohead protease [bacterium]|nr:HK97 family phage prohead protease [bacterium]
MPLTIEGDAAVTGVVTYPHWAWGTGVELAPGTLARALVGGPSVEFLMMHGWRGGLTLAATDSDAAPMGLSVESEMLSYRADMIDDHLDAVQAWQKVDAGLMREASMGYFIVDGEWVFRNGEEVFYVTELSLDGGDISIVRRGGSPQTRSRTRSEAGRWHPMNRVGWMLPQSGASRQN